MKEIKLQGQTYPVVFDMKTILNFEEITQKSFFGNTFNKLTEKIALTVAAVLSADKNAELDIDSLTSLDWAGLQEVTKAFNDVMELSLEYFHIPKVIDNSNKQGKGKGKN